MALVIKKRVSLDFLGEEYKDSYIIVRSLSVDDYERLQKSKDTVKKVVTDNFISGELQQDDAKIQLTKDNLSELSGEVYVEVFNQMMGKIDPKSQGL